MGNADFIALHLQPPHRHHRSRKSVPACHPVKSSFCPGDNGTFLGHILINPTPETDQMPNHGEFVDTENVGQLHHLRFSWEACFNFYPWNHFTSPIKNPHLPGRSPIGRVTSGCRSSPELSHRCQSLRPDQHAAHHTHGKSSVKVSSAALDSSPQTVQPAPAPAPMSARWRARWI